MSLEAPAQRITHITVSWSCKLPQMPETVPPTCMLDQLSQTVQRKNVQTPHLRHCNCHLGASINRGPQDRPKYIMVRIIGATKMGPLILGNNHLPQEKTKREPRPPNDPQIDPKYHQIEAIRPFLQVHWVVKELEAPRTSLFGASTVAVRSRFSSSESLAPHNLCW